MKEKLIMIILVIVLLATGGLFYYDKVYLKNGASGQKTTVYVALNDIAQGKKIAKEDLAVMYLSDDYALPNFVTELELIEGAYAKSSIYKDEVITSGRLTETIEEENLFRMAIEPHNAVDFKTGDVVNAYVLLNKDDPSNVVVQKLFEGEVVQGVDREISTNSTEEKGKIELLHFNLSEETALLYETAKAVSREQIIILPQKEAELKVGSNVEMFRP